MSTFNCGLSGRWSSSLNLNFQDALCSLHYSVIFFPFTLSPLSLLLLLLSRPFPPPPFFHLSYHLNFPTSLLFPLFLLLSPPTSSFSSPFPLPTSPSLPLCPRNCSMCLSLVIILLSFQILIRLEHAIRHRSIRFSSNLYYNLLCICILTVTTTEDIVNPLSTWSIIYLWSCQESVRGNWNISLCAWSWCLGKVTALLKHLLIFWFLISLLTS